MRVDWGTCVTTCMQARMTDVPTDGCYHASMKKEGVLVSFAKLAWTRTATGTTI